MGHLLLLAVAVTVATLLVRLVLPFESDNKYVDLNMWEWPACAALFGLGIMASRAGWLTAVPDRLRRQSRTVTLVTVGAAAVDLGGQRQWQPAAWWDPSPSPGFSAPHSHAGHMGRAFPEGATRR